MRLWRTPLDHDCVNVPQGIIHLIIDRCKGCELCVTYCPRDALEMSAVFNAKGYHPPQVIGAQLCVACGLCVTICPPDAIKVVPYEDEGGDRYPKEFIIDEIRCIFCGFCAEACPMDAIELTKVYDYVDYNRNNFIFDISKLKTPEKFIFKGK